jgi:predicted restriction endonuclease
MRSSEEKFLFFWLQTRTKIFEKYIDIKSHKEAQKEILNGYRKAFNELLNDIEKSPFLTQFLTEITLLNIFFNPRRVKAINDYYEYGCTLEVFNADKKEKIINRIKKYRNIDIRKAFVDIHGKFCPIKICSISGNPSP